MVFPRIPLAVTLRPQNKRNAVVEPRHDELEIAALQPLNRVSAVTESQQHAVCVLDAVDGFLQRCSQLRRHIVKQVLDSNDRAVNTVDLHDMLDFSAKRVTRNHDFALGLQLCRGSLSRDVAHCFSVSAGS